MEEILAYIRQHETAIQPLQKDYCEKLWQLSLTGDEKVEKELVEAKARYLRVYNNKEEFRQLQHWRPSASSLNPIDVTYNTGDPSTATSITAFTPSGSFGQAQGTRDPRQAQFGFKITF